MEVPNWFVAQVIAFFISGFIGIYAMAINYSKDTSIIIAVIVFIFLYKEMEGSFEYKEKKK